MEKPIQCRRPINDMDQLTYWETIFSNGEQSVDQPAKPAIEFAQKYHPNIPAEEINIIEVGSGVGNNLIFLALHGSNVTGIEFSEAAITQARLRSVKHGVDKKCQWFHQSCTLIPCDSNSFHLAIDRGCLVYLSLEDQAKTIKEIHRTLKVGGHFLFTPYCLFTHYDDGKRLSTIEQALSCLPANQWQIVSKLQMVNVEPPGEPPKVSWFEIVARKV